VAGRSRRRRRGSDLRYDMSLTFEEARHVVNTKSNNPPRILRRLHGTRSESWHRGRFALPDLRSPAANIPITLGFSPHSTCPACQARQIVKEVAASNGRGPWTRRELTNHRAALSTGFDTAHPPARGKARRARGPMADNWRAVLFLDVKEHPLARSRRGDRLDCPIPISITQASLGVDLQVHAVGARKMKIPEARKRRGLSRRRKGLADPHGGAAGGDLY